MKFLTRKEQFIAAKFGATTAPKPLTRDELILAGEEVAPLTRDEAFLGALANGGGDVIVESLTVTENGTYTADQGKAYSPVTVEVEGDFTTAQVTITAIDEVSSAHVGLVEIPILEDNTIYPRVDPGTLNRPKTVTVPLYKSGTWGLVEGDPNNWRFTVNSGDATVQQYGWQVLITGDCSINIEYYEEANADV